MEYYERYQLFGVRCVEWCEGNLRYTEYGALAANSVLRWRVLVRRHRDASGGGDGDRRGTLGEAVAASRREVPRNTSTSLSWTERQRHCRAASGGWVGFESDGAPRRASA